MKLSDLNQIEQSVADFDFLEEVESNVDFSNPNIVPAQEYIQQKRETLSFNQSIQEKETEIPDPDEPEYIVHKQYIDKFNTKCTRIEITPSVCRVCGFDVAKSRHGRWGLVPATERKTVVEALEMHTRTVHTLGDAHIIKKSQLPKQWFGSNNL